jgi:hypothetical protein
VFIIHKNLHFPEFFCECKVRLEFHCPINGGAASCILTSTLCCYYVYRWSIFYSSSSNFCSSSFYNNVSHTHIKWTFVYNTQNTRGCSTIYRTMKFQSHFTFTKKFREMKIFMLNIIHVTTWRLKTLPFENISRFCLMYPFIWRTTNENFTVWMF